MNTVDTIPPAAKTRVRLDLRAPLAEKLTRLAEATGRTKSGVVEYLLHHTDDKAVDSHN